MSSNVFVLGLDDENRAELEALTDAEQVQLHPLLSVDELTRGEINLAELVANAEGELAAFDGSVDGIIGYWDFPVSSMVPILCRPRGLPTASMEAVLKCEHKYWSRVEQQKSIDEHPAFDLVDLDSEAPPSSVRYPMWIKPVKSFSSDLAFQVRDDGEFQRALGEIREGIGRIGVPFDFALSYVDLPPEIEAAGGQACLAEEAVSGRQVTVEGYHDGTDIVVYGVIDSRNYEGTSSFLCYQYPSQLPQPVLSRLENITQRVIAQIDLRSVFNIEYFWDEDTDAIHLLEINPRQSQSHAMLFEHVDGVAHHQCMMRLALGQSPDMPYRKGPYATAAKWFHRHFTDGLVRRIPTADEVASVEGAVSGVHIEIEAELGKRLSELPQQDSYSYSLATVHIGANDTEELSAKYDQSLRALPFEIDESVRRRQ